MSQASPEKTIAAIAALHPDMKYICTHGSCFKFYELLHEIYPDAIPYMNQERDHVVTRIGTSLYDINGRVGNAFGKSGSRFHEMDESEISTAGKWVPVPRG